MIFRIFLLSYIVFSFNSCLDFSFPVHPEKSKNINFSELKKECNLVKFNYSDESFLPEFIDCIFSAYGYRGEHSDEITFFLDENVGLQGTPSLIKADYGKRLNFYRELKTKEKIVIIDDSFEIYHFSSVEDLNFANSQLMKWERLNRIFIPLKVFDEQKRILLIGRNKDPAHISKNIKDLIED